MFLFRNLFGLALLLQLAIGAASQQKGLSISGVPFEGLPLSRIDHYTVSNDSLKLDYTDQKGNRGFLLLSPKAAFPLALSKQTFVACKKKTTPDGISLRLTLLENNKPFFMAGLGERADSGMLPGCVLRVVTETNSNILVITSEQKKMSLRPADKTVLLLSMDNAQKKEAWEFELYNLSVNSRREMPHQELADDVPLWTFNFVMRKK